MAVYAAMFNIYYPQYDLERSIERMRFSDLLLHVLVHTQNRSVEPTRFLCYNLQKFKEVNLWRVRGYGRFPGPAKTNSMILRTGSKTPPAQEDCGRVSSLPQSS